MTIAACPGVGAYIRYKNASGALILLPYVDFQQDNFTKKEKGEIIWTKDALKLGSKFIGAIVAVDKALREGAEITPEPEWINQRLYILPKEDEIRKKLLTIEAKLKTLQDEKESCQQLLSEETLLKWLLYEKGKRLETAIIEALKVLGFKASQFKDSDSEFDVVFESNEGRIIGEAEGKDNKAINIDKLRQLEMNIHEDFSRPEVEQPAKGALFGNAYRITDPAKRTDYFTQKCLIASERSKTALVRSVDLFKVVQYLSANDDELYAAACRSAILQSVGIVAFPPSPVLIDSETQGIKCSTSNEGE